MIKSLTDRLNQILLISKQIDMKNQKIIYDEKECERLCRETVENKKETVSNDARSDHAKIVERRMKTYADEVKRQNKECMDEKKQYTTDASSH